MYIHHNDRFSRFIHKGVWSVQAWLASSPLCWYTLLIAFLWVAPVTCSDVLLIGVCSKVRDNCFTSIDSMVCHDTSHWTPECLYCENPRFVNTSTLNHPVHCMIHWSPLKCAVPKFPMHVWASATLPLPDPALGQILTETVQHLTISEDARHPKYGQMITKNLRYLQWIRETQPAKQPYKGNPASILGTPNFLWWDRKHIKWHRVYSNVKTTTVSHLILENNLVITSDYPLGKG